MKVKTIKRMLAVCAVFAFFSVFLFTNAKPSPKSYLVNNSDLLSLALGEQITDPTFTGVTNSNDAFSIGAEAAIPNGPRPSQVSLVSPSASIELSSGIFAFARSDNGNFDVEQRTVELSGGAIITSSDGYRIDADAMVLDLENSLFIGQNDVVLNSQSNTISADSFRMEPKSTDNLQKHFVFTFKNNVKLTYIPKADEN